MFFLKKINSQSTISGGGGAEGVTFNKHQLIHLPITSSSRWWSNRRITSSRYHNQPPQRVLPPLPPVLPNPWQLQPLRLPRQLPALSWQQLRPLRLLHPTRVVWMRMDRLCCPTHPPITNRIAIRWVHCQGDASRDRLSLFFMEGSVSTYKTSNLGTDGSFKRTHLQKTKLFIFSYVAAKSPVRQCPWKPDLQFTSCRQRPKKSHQLNLHY